jgi:1,2-diacylglycerol 3-alpha-glucosyltransferase
MNIGIVTTWFERGAAYVSRAYRDTLETGHNVFIYARAGEKFSRGDPGWDDDTVTWGKSVPAGIVTFIDWKDFSSWVKRNQIECLIFNEQHSWEILWNLREKLDVAIGSYVDYYTQVTIPFFNIYDFLLCNTRRHYQVFKNHPQATYIPWGTDIDLFKPVLKEHHSDELVIFHSCGLSPDRKGTGLLVKAFAQVQGNVRLVLHTQTPLKDFPPLLDEISRDARIEVIEAEVGAPGLYHLGDVYAYPSVLEGIGLTIAEALACGLPVVTTDEPPMNEFVEHGINGRLAAVERRQERKDGYYWLESIPSIEALVDALQFYVDHKTDMVDFQRKARLYAEEHLDWRKNSAELPDWITGAARKRARVSQQLIEEIKRYEYSKYPYPAFAIPFVRMARYGGREVKHYLEHRRIVVKQED